MMYKTCSELSISKIFNIFFVSIANIISNFLNVKTKGHTSIWANLDLFKNRQFLQNYINELYPF